MKVLSAEQIREADRYTIQNEPVSSVNLMERASLLCTEWLLAKYKDAAFVIVCGNGNNGGDGLCIARQLFLRGKRVTVKIVRASKNDSADFTANLQRLRNECEVTIEEFTAHFSLRNEFTLEQPVIVDAIFGSGLNREPEGLVAEAIASINHAPYPKVAIDIPSGLFCDDNTNNSYHHVVRADFTLTFQAPKLAFFFAEHANNVGEFVVLNVGLHPVFLADATSYYHYTTPLSVKHMLIPRGKFNHKGTLGHALLVAGSEGKTGAAVLCTRSALRAGAGLVTAYVPLVSRDVMQEAVPEAMTVSSSENSFIGGRIPTAKFDAIGVGPGIGVSRETEQALKLLLNEFAGPMVWDADALNILSENKTWLAFLPKNTILTPHPGEFDRLTEKHISGFSRMQTQRNFAMKYGVIVVLKGAHTSIAMPDGNVFFNSSGNPGMATGGSGDVLTGIVTSLLAQGYSAIHAAIVGVYLHGLAGDIAASVRGQESLIAGDITENLSGAFRMLREL